MSLPNTNKKPDKVKKLLIYYDQFYGYYPNDWGTSLQHVKLSELVAPQCTRLLFPSILS